MVRGGSVSFDSRKELPFLSPGEIGLKLYFLSISFDWNKGVGAPTLEKLFLVRETLGYRMLYLRVVFTESKHLSIVSDFAKTLAFFAIP